ncbi:hypothetical protein Hanom_Chr14g01329221 [Helianthus anomalus]
MSSVMFQFCNDRASPQPGQLLQRAQRQILISCYQVYIYESLHLKHKLQINMV